MRARSALQTALLTATMLAPATRVGLAFAEPASISHEDSAPDAADLATAPVPPNADTSRSDFARAEAPKDPTGGAYTTPTLLFVPAAAVPVWNVRVITSVSMQGPTAADRLATGTSLGFQPGLGGELGLPAGFTLGAGTVWVGGDTKPMPVSGGLSPYFQARYHVAGGRDGRGFQLGSSLTYKFVGFDGDPGEMEFAVSSQYRHQRYEAGLEGVLGKDFATTSADGEFHAYAVYRIIPEVAIGVAGQVRIAIVSQPDDSTYDVIGGAIASLTLGQWQLGGLGGASTVGQEQGRAGVLGQVFATARF